MSLIFETGHIDAMRSAGWVVWAAVADLGLIVTALGSAIGSMLIRRHPISLAAPFLLLLPAFSVFGDGAGVHAGLAVIMLAPRRIRAEGDFA